MTSKIETTPGKRSATIRLIGRIRTEHLTELRAQPEGAGPTAVLDLGEVSLVNLEVVRFLIEVEAQGVQLLNCPTYIHNGSIERK